MGVAEAIAARRRAFGLAEADVADLAGMPVAALRALEHNTRPPTAFELARIADALAVDPASLWRGEADTEDPRRGSARFLAGPTLTGLAARDHRLLARAAEVGRIGGGLWGLLGKPRTALMARRTVTPLALRGEPWEQGYALGRADRLAIAPSGKPLPSVQALLEAHGVHVAFIDFEGADVIAASLSEPGALPVVVLNRRHPRVKATRGRRSVLVHELCHIMHDATDQDVVSMASRRSQEGEPWEQRANGYGPSFLAPRDWVRVEDAPPAEMVRRLATDWMLSWEGACWHAKNLRLISPRAASALLAEHPVGWRAPGLHESVARTPREGLGPACEASPLVAGLVADLVAEAFAEGEISQGRAEEILVLR